MTPTEAAAGATNFVSTLRAEISTAGWLRNSVGETEDAGEFGREFDDDGDGDDSDEWDDPVSHGSSLPPPLYGSMGAGGDLEIFVDAPQVAERTEAMAPSAVAAVVVRNDQAEEELTEQQKAEQRRLKRQHNAKRRSHSEALHRTSLLCWLAHGRLLSDQGTDTELQSRLLSLCPPEFAESLAAGSGSEAQVQERLATWLHAYLKPPRADPDAAAAAASTGRGRGRGHGRGGAGAAASSPASSGSGGGRSSGSSASSSAEGGEGGHIIP